jgi:exodeoxyribonuclease VII small subunit
MPSLPERIRMKKNYEETIAELKDIVRKIEEGEAGLEETMKLYERGTLLVKACEKSLEEAELKITELQSS